MGCCEEEIGGSGGALGEFWKALQIQKLPIKRPCGRYVISVVYVYYKAHILMGCAQIVKVGDPMEVVGLLFFRALTFVRLLIQDQPNTSKAFVWMT